MAWEKDERVGAVSHTRGKELFFYGFGVYAGEEVPESAVGWIAEALREHGQHNPKLVLDNGDVVWGCECWWSSEAEIERRLAEWRAEGGTVVEIRIAEQRARVAAFAKALA
jgi:hypothetical protein